MRELRDYLRKGEIDGVFNCFEYGIVFVIEKLDGKVKWNEDMRLVYDYNSSLFVMIGWFLGKGGFISK